MIVGCLMATEDRAPIVGVSFASAICQRGLVGLVDQRLLCLCPVDQVYQYQEEWDRIGGGSYGLSTLPLLRRPSVPETLHGAANSFLESIGGGGDDDICTMWDDDDISPHNRLVRTISAIRSFHPRPVIASYSKGWFVNARTLHGYLLDLEDKHLWGGTLAWNRAAWQASTGFWDSPMPGYDRHFAKSACLTRQIAIVAPDEQLPVALCHDKNVASKYQKRGDPMENKLQDWLPEKVFAELKRFQKFCVDQRIYPPLSE